MVKIYQTSKIKVVKKIFSEFARLATSNGDGFVDYVWPKPGFEKPQPKIGYIRLFKPFNWVIGTGEYVSDVTSNMQKEALQAISQMKYGKSGYFIIIDPVAKMLMHAVKPALNGKVLYNFQDKKGNYLFRDIVTAAKKPQGGLSKYYWEKTRETRCAT